MGLSIDGGWSKSVVQAVLAGRHRGRGQKEHTLAASVNVNHHLAQYPVTSDRCVNLPSLTQKALTCLMWGLLVKRANDDISQSKNQSCSEHLPCSRFCSSAFTATSFSFSCIQRNHNTAATHTHTPAVICCRAHTLGGCVLLNVTPLKLYENVTSGQPLDRR